VEQGNTSYRLMKYITVPGIVYAVKSGERISKEFDYRLIN
jgi:hypothetical protein